jgi:hypothetical protein
VVFSVSEHVLNKSISMELCQFNPQTISNIILITITKIIMEVVVVFNSREVQDLTSRKAERSWLYSNLCSVPLRLGVRIYSESELK